MTLATDSMAGYLMQQGLVDLVIVGADRIAANGDTANKIGTYTLAVLAWRHRLPFYVVAPLSTIDMAIADGQAIPIEQRSTDEVTGYGGVRWAPAPALRHRRRRRMCKSAVSRRSSSQSSGVARRVDRVVLSSCPQLNVETSAHGTRSS